MRKKYLIIGDANSMHVYNFVKTVLLPLDYEIHLMTLSCERVKESYREFYKINNIILHSIAEKVGENVPNKTKKQRFINFIKKWKMAKKLPNTDICHIHSVYKTSMYLYWFNRKKFKKMIASYWGSDILDVSKSTLKIREKCFYRAKAITVTVKKLYVDFQKIHGNKFNEKLRICRFATAGLECIHDISARKSILDCRNEMSVPIGKIVITCGYNACVDQHQDMIIKKISSLNTEIKKKIHLIIPMQYGKNDFDYIKKVYVEAQTCGCSFEILEEYVPFEKNAVMALVTDIYIHMRDTDAFSNSLKEQVYAGSKVIMGEWLKYYELEEMKASIILVDSFDKLPEVLMETIDNMGEKRLFEPIYEMYSTKSVIGQWLQVINCCD